jgi:glycosyltransferase involved in cell wall biosynthesis
VVAVRVVIDVSPLELTRAGTARYIDSLADRLELDRIAFAGARRLDVLTRELWWYPFRLGAYERADVLHCPTYYGPLRPSIPTVVTVHDLAVFRYPQAFGRWTRLYVPRVIPSVLRAARRIVAVSEFTAGEIERVVGIARDRVTVVPNGVEPVFTPDGDAAQGDYALAVGTLEPRKNIAVAARAANHAGLRLRVVGERGWGRVDVDGDGVEWVGRLGDEALAQQYRGARCLVYPSLYEGFGIPVLEAMACGTPVVTSRGGATEEVAGDAAVLVDPHDVADVVAGIERAVADAAALRERGLARAAGFSWDETARRTQAVYEDAA